MQNEQEQPEVGRFEVEVASSGRRRWQTVSRFTLRCDAIGLHHDEILLLSVAGAETSLRALTAGLRSSAKDQKRLEYTVHTGAVHRAELNRCPEGYRIYRTKLEYGLWHVLCLAKRDGFMPVMNEEVLWQHLHGSQFTTPILRAWMPWLYQKMKSQENIVELMQTGCQAGLLLADSDDLDSLVSEGIQNGHLSIPGQKGNPSTSISTEIQNLDQYMLTYGAMLGQQAEQTLNPLHVPGRDSLPDMELLPEILSRRDCCLIEATRKALNRQKALLLVGEMGTGKTIMGMSAIHAHAQGRPYRALVFCPGQLIHKWEREIRETVPDVEVIQLESWKSLLHLDRTKKPGHVEWYVIARDRATSWARNGNPLFTVTSTSMMASFVAQLVGCVWSMKNGNRFSWANRRRTVRQAVVSGSVRAKCEWVLTNERGQEDPEREQGGRLEEGCGSALWQMNGELWRYEPALFIKRHLRNFFKYLVLDEVHEEKGYVTRPRAMLLGALAACCQKVIALTGTLVGGYAEHLRPLLFRLSPRSLVQEGLLWSNVTAFNERYGRIETRITERSSGPGEDNRMSRGSKTTVKSVRPGIMPILFGRHLIDKAVFLSLNEVADNLPPLEEECIRVRMDEELAAAYKQDVEKPLAEAIKVMMKRKDRRLLGTMLQTLLAYPDYPFGWNSIGYRDDGEFVIVANPPNLPDDVIRPKEQALLDLVESEKTKGRKVWIYVQFTDKHDVQGRLEKTLRESGLQGQCAAFERFVGQARGMDCSTCSWSGCGDKPSKARGNGLGPVRQE